MKVIIEKKECEEIKSLLENFDVESIVISEDSIKAIRKGEEQK